MDSLVLIYGVNLCYVRLSQIFDRMRNGYFPEVTYYLSPALTICGAIILAVGVGVLACGFLRR